MNLLRLLILSFLLMLVSDVLSAFRWESGSFEGGTRSATAISPARYNGDISFVASQVRGRRQQLFGVKYDTYDRMTEAKFYERVSSGSTGYRVDAYSENLAYDDRGNIEQLRRKGVYKSGVRYYQTVLDSLNYKFEQSDGADNNRLRKISDSGSSNRGYKVGSGGEVTSPPS